LSNAQGITEQGESGQSPETEKPRRVHLFIVNPRSFRYAGGPDMRTIINEIRAYFRDNPGEDYHLHISRYPRDAVGVIHRFAASVGGGVIVRVYAVGGDGILFDCLNGIVGTANRELAIVPYGSSNDFLRSFGEGRQAPFLNIAKQISAGTIKTDIIYCGSNYAMNFCSVGVEAVSIMYTARLMRAFDWAVRHSRGIVPILYTLGGICGILDKKTREQRYSVVFDGERADGTYTCINVANGPCYGGNMSAVTGAMPNDGILDMLLVESGSALSILNLLPRYLRGEYYNYPESFSYRRARRVEIASDTPISINMDGEVFFDTSLTLEVIPRAVDIVAVDGLDYMRRPNARELP
jgi:diacylglycerol kinase family enzyme